MFYSHAADMPIYYKMQEAVARRILAIKDVVGGFLHLISA